MRGAGWVDRQADEALALAIAALREGTVGAEDKLKAYNDEGAGVALDLTDELGELTPERIEYLAGAVASAWCKSDMMVRAKRCQLAAMALRELAKRLCVAQPITDSNLPEPFPRVHSYDPSGARSTVTVEWLDGQYVSYTRYPEEAEGKTPIVWAFDSNQYDRCYIFSDEFIQMFPEAPRKGWASKLSIQPSGQVEQREPD